MKKIVLISLFFVSTCLLAQSAHNHTRIFSCSPSQVSDSGYYVRAFYIPESNGYILDLYKITFNQDIPIGSEDINIQKKADHYEVTQVNDKDNNKMLLTVSVDPKKDTQASAYLYIELNGKAIPENHRKMSCELLVDLSLYVK